MSFADCITGKAGQGLVRPEDARRAKDRFAEFVDDYQDRGASFREAKRKAAQRLQAEIERDMRRRRRMRLRQTEIETGIRARVAVMPDQVDRAMYSVLEFDPTNYTGPSVAQRIEAVRGEAHAAMAGFLGQFRSTHAGLRRETAGLPSVFRPSSFCPN